MKENKHGRRELPPAYVNGQMGNVKPQTTGQFFGDWLLNWKLCNRLSLYTEQPHLTLFRPVSPVLIPQKKILTLHLKIWKMD